MLNLFVVLLAFTGFSFVPLAHGAALPTEYVMIAASTDAPPNWLYKVPEDKDGLHYFIGLSGFHASELSAREKALNNVRAEYARYVGVAVDQVDEVMRGINGQSNAFASAPTTDAMKSRIRVKKWYWEKYRTTKGGIFQGEVFKFWVLADSPTDERAVVQAWINSQKTRPMAGQGSEMSNPAVLIPAKADTTSPLITVSSPDVQRGIGLTVKKSSLHIAGTASDDSGIAEVMVNGQFAALDAQGNFSIDIFLRVGENRIEVIALDTRGNRGSKTFMLNRESAAPAPALPVVAAPSKLETGRYYALIVGIQDYSDSAIPALDNPLKDAQRVYDVLTKSYSFDLGNVTFLKNPEQAKIIEVLDALANRVTDIDSLFIFYAGHGFWDEKLKQGFWLPVDARRESRARWLSNSTLKDYIGGIRSKHTLLVADACFSGGIFKTRSAFSDAPKAVRELYKLPSRKAMTSGAMREVPDRSVFVEYLLKRLTANDEAYLSSEQLFASMRQAVINNSPNGQVPQFGEIRETGDEGGDFVFVKR